MNMPSELVEIELTDSQGTNTYYTYSGYYAENDRKMIKEYRRDLKRRTLTSAFFTGLAAYYASRRTNMTELTYRTYQVPKRGLLSGMVGFVGGLLTFDYIGTQQAQDFERKITLKSAHLPLWRNKRAAVNPDRAYFELVDAKDNEPSIFHSGLTAESAAELIPDRIIGTIPSKPHLPTH